MRSVFILLAAYTLLGRAAFAFGADFPASIADASKPDAEVTLQGGSVAARIGFTWGHCELNYRGGSRAFSIRGVSVVDVGAPDFSAAGAVFNWRNFADLTGNYVAAVAGVTLAGGDTDVYLKNVHGVVIKRISTDVGQKFKPSPQCSCPHASSKREGR